jgi:hypothetical protein
LDRVGFRKVKDEDADPYEDFEINKPVDQYLMEVDQSEVSKKIYDMRIPVLSDGFVPFSIVLFFAYKGFHGDFEKLDTGQEDDVNILKKIAKIEIKNLGALLRKEAHKVKGFAKKIRNKFGFFLGKTEEGPRQTKVICRFVNKIRESGGSLSFCQNVLFGIQKIHSNQLEHDQLPPQQRDSIAGHRPIGLKLLRR